MQLGYNKPDIYILMGYTNRRLNEYEYSEDNFKIAEGLSGNVEQYLTIRANIAIQIFELGDALEYFNKLIDIDHNELSYYFFKGIVYIYMDKQDNAIMNFEQYIENGYKGNFFLLTNFHLSKLYFNKNEYDKVIKCVTICENNLLLYSNVCQFRAMSIMIKLLDEKDTKIFYDNISDRIEDINTVINDIKHREQYVSLNMYEKAFIAIALLLKNDYIDAEKYYKDAIQLDDSLISEFEKIGFLKKLNSLK